MHYSAAGILWVVARAVLWGCYSVLSVFNALFCSWHIMGGCQGSAMGLLLCFECI